MTYTTITFNDKEYTLADIGVNMQMPRGSRWSRHVQNQGKDELTLNIVTPMDGADIFPYGAQITVKIGRIASRVNPVNPTLPASIYDGGGELDFSGGTQFFWGYCVDNDRIGEPGEESFNYKFVGPYQFFFEALPFKKLALTWNGAAQIPVWQSDVILGLSLSPLTGPGDTVPNSTSTNLMSLAQQVKEICGCALLAANTAQANPSAMALWTAGIETWPEGPQFQCDQLTSEINAAGYDLLETPSANVLIDDYAAGPVGGQSTASGSLPAGSYLLRAPLDAVNDITCADAMRRTLQWLGGVGSPVVWTDHTQSPPVIRVGLRNKLPQVTLPLTGITVKTKIKKRTDLIPSGVFYKYKIQNNVLNNPFSVTVEDIAAYVGGVLTEGIGQYGGLTTLAGAAIAAGTQTTLENVLLLPRCVMQTFDFLGARINGASCTIKTETFTPGSPSYLQSLFTGLQNVMNLNTFAGATITNAETGAVLYQNGAWTGTVYGNRIVDGQAASWMLASNNPSLPVASQTVKAKLSVPVSGTQTASGAAGTASLGKRDYHEKTIEITLTNLTSGTYYNVNSAIAGEPIPYGLAGYILALESIPQYEGSITIQETEITDQCPIGNAFNISGGLAEWATMATPVQEVYYSDNGQTEITFGPAAHLNASQFLQRFKTNMGPRWYNLINADPLNQSNPGPTALGSNIPAQAPDNGGDNWTFRSLLASVQNQLSSGGGALTLPQGIHHDTGVAASPFTGATPSGVPPWYQGPALTLAQGSGANPLFAGNATVGESNAWIRISLADLRGTVSGKIQQKQIYLQELPVCVLVNGSWTPMFQLFLCSAPYPTSLSQS